MFWSCRHCTSATDGDRGWACSQSPKQHNKRLADSMGWPETAQATVLLTRAGLLLKMQAELGTEANRHYHLCQGGWAGSSVPHRQPAGGRAKLSCKKTSSRTNEDRSRGRLQVLPSVQPPAWSLQNFGPQLANSGGKAHGGS